MILCTVALHAPLSMGFSRQEYWSELPCLPQAIVYGVSESDITNQLTLSLSQHILSHIAKRAYTWIMKTERRNGSRIAISEVKWMASNGSVWKHCRKWSCTWFSWVDTPFNEVDSEKKKISGKDKLCFKNMRLKGIMPDLGQNDQKLYKCDSSKKVGSWSHHVGS